MSSKSTPYDQQLLWEIQQTPQEFYPGLLQLIRLFREGLTLHSAEESFRLGWKEAMSHETLPIDSLWEGIQI